MEDCEHQDSVRLCKINSTHHHRENNITQVQSADVFCGVTSHHYKPLLELFLLYHLSAFSEAVSLARLVEAEIVFPLSWDYHQYRCG